MDKHTPLPVDKLLVPSDDHASPVQSSSILLLLLSVVLVLAGSFNPPTHMHLKLFELARDALNIEGYIVLRDTCDSVQKRGLLSADHRIKMCQVACKTSQFVLVDEWEANQGSFQPTYLVLISIRNHLYKNQKICQQSLKVMLVCGSNLLKLFTIPGVWIPEQIKIICRDFGIVCIRREGEDVASIISNDEILSDNKTLLRKLQVGKRDDQICRCGCCEL